MEKILLKVNFQKFLEDLKANFKVIGPTRKGGGTATYSYACFDEIEDLDDLEMDYKFSMLSPKMVFFPDNQELYGYEKVGADIKLVDLRDKWGKDIAIVGLHPCDIAALLCLDRVFREEPFEEEYYNSKRQRTAIIGMTCTEPKGSCFCNLVGSGPDIEEGYDLLLTDIGDRFYFRSGTELGDRLISANYFMEPTEGDRDRRSEEVKRVAKELGPGLHVDTAQRVMEEKYDDSLWDEFSSKCVTCGSCNMVCPTCHCFSIVDKTNFDQTRGKRILVWDSCHFERFALMAGNINVRGEKESRFKHRLYDKYYYDPMRYGRIFCVGCGRCLEFCPSHIDIRDALNKLGGVK
ncbi:hypothetical protein DRJ17_06830 [Candidatus Woesearchaeota archaeon]|nr:MAG: hypothetical protein DRJ17_06830 [Candidatus Woesearchaeota archaeon]